MMLADTNTSRRLITETEFILAVLASLYLSRHAELSFRGTEMDRAFEGVWLAVDNRAAELDLNMPFCLVRNEFHGDCAALRDTMVHLATTGRILFREDGLIRFSQFNEVAALQAIARTGIPAEILAGAVAANFKAPCRL